MQHIIPIILYASFIQAHPHSTYGNYENLLTYHNDRSQYLPLSPSVYPSPYPAPAASNYYGYYRRADYSKFNSDPYGDRPLREPQPSKFNQPDPFALDLEYPTNAQPEDSLPEIDPAAETKAKDDDSEGTDSTYSEDLELTENFANYLRKKTQVELLTPVNDPARQYNALLVVIMALARAVRNTCSDFNELYDQIYASTVETYYKYGLTYAEKVPALMEDYIQRGNARIAKIRRLREDVCEKDLFCSIAIESKIKETPLIYVKELETLEAMAHLARSYYSYLEEFSEAAQKANVLSYLQNNKDRLKNYVMNVVNAVDHLADKPVKCDKD
uniref:Uncharacterized protein n=1 Tax=Heliothis virescens TaxID=7102 RepID=A0A2A4JVE3_HELVI